MMTTPTKDDPSQSVPTNAIPNSEPNQKMPEPPVSVAVQMLGRLKSVITYVPLLAIIISLCALAVSMASLSLSMGYIRPIEDHDVVARVLGVSALTKGYSSLVTNGELFVDVALINKGNQKEIIREAFLCYSDNRDFQDRGRSWQRNNTQLNVQLEKGEKRVQHISTPFNSVNTGKRMWLGVAVRAIAPNADDVEIIWPVCEIELATNGNGASTTYNKDQTPLIQVISNKRLPHQKLAPDGF
jgi:hypothetical protein